jgi:ubiquitin-conjugating enzyme E2 J1
MSSLEKGKGSWNAGNPAVKRILREATELRQNPCREFVAQPSEDSVFEWLFTMRGPAETEYEDGFYRGRIILQSNYPFAPPDIMLLTPNGRFELNTKICLSISSYHPENWHPTWGVKTVLHALRDFMSTPGNNGIGAIEYSKDKRRQLAKESHSFVCPVAKTPIQNDIDLMNASPPSMFTPPVMPASDSKTDDSCTPPPPAATVDSAEQDAVNETTIGTIQRSPSSDHDNDCHVAVPTPTPQTNVNMLEQREVVPPPALVEQPNPVMNAENNDAQVVPPGIVAERQHNNPKPPARHVVQQQRRGATGGQPEPTVLVIDEKMLNTSIMIVLVAIFAILAKKALQGDWWFAALYLNG